MVKNATRRLLLQIRHWGNYCPLIFLKGVFLTVRKEGVITISSSKNINEPFRIVINSSKTLSLLIHFSFWYYAFIFNTAFPKNFLRPFEIITTNHVKIYCVNSNCSAIKRDFSFNRMTELNLLESVINKNIMIELFAVINYFIANEWKLF